MKKYTILFILLAGIILGLKAQDCEISVNDAKNYYQKNEYEKALLIIADIEKNCPNYFIEVKDIKTICEKEIGKKKASLTVGKANVEFPSSGGTEKVTIEHKNCTWTVSNNHPKWITLKNSDNQLTITCEKNTASTKRDGNITITSNVGLTKKIHVSQEKDALNVSYDNLSFQSDGGKQTIYIESNVYWKVDSQSAYWFNAQKQGDKVTVTCNQNTASSKRSGSFTIKSDNGDSVVVTITQDAEDVYLNLTERLHYGSNGGSNLVKVYTNATNWSIGNVSDTWVKATKRNDSELVIEVMRNDYTTERSAYVRIRANNRNKDIYISQDKRGGLSGLSDDYFDYMGTQKLTYFEASAYVLGQNGLRLSTLKYRWKYVEADLINLNLGIYDVTSVDWEPSIRGFLPLTGSGRCWAAYMGLGYRVHFYESDEQSPILLEVGTEFNWENRDDMSTRIFIRYDGGVAVGVAFDLCKWSY